MESSEERILLVMHRSRRPIRTGIRGSYLVDAPPEERTFEILDSSERAIGKIVYTEYVPDMIAKALTPWGQATIMTEGGLLKTGERGIISLMMEKGIVASMIPHLFRWDFSFANGTVLAFGIRPGRYVMSFSGDIGTIKVRQEEGRSENGCLFVRWTILASGILPIAEEDLTATLTMFESLQCLDFVNIYGA